METMAGSLIRKSKKESKAVGKRTLRIFEYLIRGNNIFHSSKIT